MLNSTFFGVASWGIVGFTIATGFDFFALALVMANTAATPWRIHWIRFALAGMCVGMNVMEAGGCWGSVQYVHQRYLSFSSPLPRRTAPRLSELGRRHQPGWRLLPYFAGFIAFQTVQNLEGDTSLREWPGRPWDSQPRQQGGQMGFRHAVESAEKGNFGTFCAGFVSGFKMDTPNEMPAALQDAYRGGSLLGRHGARPPAKRSFC